MLYATSPDTRFSIWFAPIPHIRIFPPDDKRNKTIALLFVYCDGKRYTTNVLFMIATAHDINPMFLFIPITNAIKRVVYIAVANVIQLILFC